MALPTELDQIKQAFISAKELLLAGETELPDGVKTSIRFCVKHGLWYLLSRNPPVTSCRDAASRRSRLGYLGIPLSDELRSYLAEQKSEDGTTAYILLHCRGHQSFDFEKISEVSELSDKEIVKANVSETHGKGIGYGLINPFTVHDIIGGQLQQVFDETVISQPGDTYTMMTNAGDRTWAIEFDPRELVILKEFICADVANIHEVEPEQASIGILTGNAPDSGALLWNLINTKSREKLGGQYKGDISNPQVHISSAPFMGWTMELSQREKFIEELVMQEVAELRSVGVKKIGIACNTTQYFNPKILKALSGDSASYISLPDTVEKFIDSHEEEQIYVVGIGDVVSNSKWSGFKFLHEKANVIMPSPDQIEYITRLAYLVKETGVTPRTYQMFRSVIRRSPAEKVLLMLTELSMIMAQYRRKKFGGHDIIDSMELYAEEFI